ncbi:MAG: alpha-galactosidase [Clostridia bacterium]|nr:alpha-galactosidase [Clostridia bacterium]
MKKIKNKEIIEITVTTVLFGLLIYAAYSLWYIFYGTDSGADVHLYTGLSGIALGWFLLLAVQAVFKKCPLTAKLVSFLAGNALFQGVIWGLNAKLNETCTDNEPVIIGTYTVTFAVSAVSLLTVFILRAKNKYKILNAILAVFYFVASCVGIYMFNQDNIKALEYKKNLQFDTITADALAVTDEEKSLSAQWFDKSFLSSEGEYPFTFKVDGKTFDPSDWEKTVEDSEKTYNGAMTKAVKLKNSETGLEITVEAALYEESSTCQWTVYIKNTASENSGVISDFYALSSSLPTGEADIYYSLGSDTSASDFSLIKKKLNSSGRVFSGVDGKPTQANLPYFNICGENMGIILGIGWTGQWAASLAAENDNAAITVRQEHFNAYLLPGEEVRSPMVSLSFYKNDNPLKGFNLFRGWIMDCVYPENVTKNYYTVMEVAGPMSERTSDEIIEILEGFDGSVYEDADAFWMDAGWYTYNEGWYDGVGNWTPDTTRYDNGISELSGYAAEKGLGHVLWYEPERVYPGTLFHQKGSENDQWLISVGDDNCMWNLADEDAFAYYCEFLLASMKENGVTVYRQDFNFDPLEYWHKADSEYYGGRTGICENHYVTNLYRFLDFITENIEGLIIDNCASGGKRLDLEMAHRSIPFWRSDYNCSIHSDLFDATQSHTYGISFWLPISGTALNMTNEYSARSAIMPLVLMDFYSHTLDHYDLCEEQRALMTDNYYPIDFGSYDKNKILSMQFGSDDGLKGTALVYKRADVKDKEYTVVLNGLAPQAVYEIYDKDAPENITSLTGEELMTKGFTIPLPEGEKAIILMYSAK